MVKAGAATDRADRRAGAAARAGRRDHRRRQRPLPGHDPARAGAARAGPAVPRHRHLGRRGGRAPRPLDHGGRRRRGVRARARRSSRRSPPRSTARPAARISAPDGAGHFVKMVHNGIEYADMQLIAETYALMSDVPGPRLSRRCRRRSPSGTGASSNSYLIEITADILGKRDPETGQPMVEVILDRAGQKGTGGWAVAAALELGVPAPTIAEAVAARSLSALKAERVEAAERLAGPAARERRDLPRRRSAARRAARGQALRLRPGLRAHGGRPARRTAGRSTSAPSRPSGAAAASSARASSTDQGGLRPRPGARPTCCSIPTSPTLLGSGAERPARGRSPPRRATASRRRRSARRWPTSTATARRGCRPT